MTFLANLRTNDRADPFAPSSKFRQDDPGSMDDRHPPVAFGSSPVQGLSLCITPGMSR